MKKLKDFLNDETISNDTPIIEFKPKDKALDIMDNTLAYLIDVLADFRYEDYDIYETSGAMHIIPIEEQHTLTGCGCHPFIIHHEGEEGKVIYIHNIRR